MTLLCQCAAFTLFIILMGLAINYQEQADSDLYLRQLDQVAGYVAEWKRDREGAPSYVELATGAAIDVG